MMTLNLNSVQTSFAYSPSILFRLSHVIYFQRQPNADLPVHLRNIACTINIYPIIYHKNRIC